MSGPRTAHRQKTSRPARPHGGRRILATGRTIRDANPCFTATTSSGCPTSAFGRTSNWKVEVELRPSARATHSARSGRQRHALWRGHTRSACHANALGVSDLIAIWLGRGHKKRIAWPPKGSKTIAFSCNLASRLRDRGLDIAPRLGERQMREVRAEATAEEEEVITLDELPLQAVSARVVLEVQLGEGV